MLKLNFLHDVILCIKKHCNVRFYIDIHNENINYKITLLDYSAPILWSLKHRKPIYLDSVQLRPDS